MYRLSQYVLFYLEKYLGSLAEVQAARQDRLSDFECRILPIQSCLIDRITEFNHDEVFLSVPTPSRQLRYCFIQFLTRAEKLGEIRGVIVFVADKNRKPDGRFGKSVRSISLKIVNALLVHRSEKIAPAKGTRWMIEDDMRRARRLETIRDVNRKFSLSSGQQRKISEDICSGVERVLKM